MKNLYAHTGELFRIQIAKLIYKNILEMNSQLLHRYEPVAFADDNATTTPRD